MQTESNSFPNSNQEALPGIPGVPHSRRQPPKCANCDIDILWPPTVAQGKTYCCTGCAAGGPCSCDYSLYRSTSISGVIYYLD